MYPHREAQTLGRMFGSSFRLLTLPLSQSTQTEISHANTVTDALQSCCESHSLSPYIPTGMGFFGRALGAAVVCLHSMAGKIATLASHVASHDSSGILNP